MNKLYWNAILYGPRQAGMTDPMFGRVTKGASDYGAADSDFLYAPGKCLRIDQTLCFPLGTPYYQVWGHSFSAALAAELRGAGGWPRRGSPGSFCGLARAPLGSAQPGTALLGCAGRV